MSDSRADAIIRRHEQLAAERANWEGYWQEISEYLIPRLAYLNESNQSQGQRKTQRLFDSTAPLALGRFAAAMEAMLTPRNQTWHKLKADDEALNERPQVKRYLEEVNRRLFKARYSPLANFSSQVNEFNISLGAFGTGAFFVDEVLGIGIRYKTLHLSEVYFAESAAGLVDTVHRKFQYSARQAAQRFGRDVLPPAIQAALENAPDRQFDFIHAVYPNEERVHGRADFRGMDFTSCYVAVDGKAVVGEGGYRTMPYMISRYVTGPRETYGRSPAMDAFPDIRTANEMHKTILRAGQKIVDPPLLLQEDGALNAMDLRSGALNYGYLANDGEALVKPLETKGRVDIGVDLLTDKRRAINDHFLVTLFQILVEEPGEMTATEVLQRAQEKGALLAPAGGRQMSEFLGPMITRELDILAHAGQLPEMPAELVEAQGEVKYEYDSPLTRAQRAEEGVGILNVFNAVAPIAEVKPDVLDKLDIDYAVEALTEIYGAPPKLLRTPEALKEIRDAKREAADTQTLIEGAPLVAGAAKDLAQAQAMAGAVPNPPLLPAA